MVGWEKVKVMFLFAGLIILFVGFFVSLTNSALSDTSTPKALLHQPLLPQIK